MRSTELVQMSLGQIAIEDIDLNPDLRDDIPAILLVVQAIYSDAELTQRIFGLLTKHLLVELGADSKETAAQSASMPAPDGLACRRGTFWSWGAQARPAL